MSRSRLILTVLLLALCVVLILFSRSLGLDINSLRDQIDLAREWKSENEIQFALGFFALYVVSTAFSLPIAVPLGLAAGAIFGFWRGVLIASFASTLGATLSFLAARYLLGDAVHKRFGTQMNAIDAGIKRDGARYLFTLRLIPIFPFFAINLLMGLTTIPVLTYVVVSQIGMLPGTMAFVNAGTALGEIESLSNIFSTRLIVSFAILGFIPWIAKLLVNAMNRRKLYAPWQKPAKFDRNLIVIGGGAAGLVSSYIAAAVKAKVTLVEVNEMGGDCLNTGCVPSKALIAAGKRAHELSKTDVMGVSASEVSIDFPQVMQSVRNSIERIAPHDSIERYEGLGVEVKTGYAKLLDPWRVEIASADGKSEILSARSIILATGAKPFVPPIPGLESVPYLTSDTLWDDLSARTEAPSSAMILGGGPIGAELGQALSRLGTKVTIIEAADRLVPREDEEISSALKAQFESENIIVATGEKAIHASHENGRIRITTEGAEGERHHEAEILILALGRAARMEGFGLETLGIETSRSIESNAYLETNYPNIFVAGDATGPYQFTHMAGHQAWYASVNALFGRFRKFKLDNRVVPWATFTDPEIARVGISEAEAKAAGIEYDCYEHSFSALDRAITDGHDHGRIKLLTKKGSDKIIGAVIIGPQASELIAEIVLAMKHKLGLNKLLGTIHIYPTMSEVNKAVAGAWRRASANERVLAVLKSYHDWQRK